MKKWFLIIILLCFAGLFIFLLRTPGNVFNYLAGEIKNNVGPTATPSGSPMTISQGPTPSQPPAGKTFLFSFSSKGVIEESGEIFESKNSDWSVSSGAYLYLENGVGKTIQGSLPAGDKWRQIYDKENPVDTDNGFHPQNIFRLVQRGSWLNFVQQAYFKITADNLSESANRNESNGLLLFNRYQDANNLYYTGIRADGAATIKKKKNGTYYTLVQKKFLEGAAYERDKNPNLLPKNEWLGLRSEVKTNPDGTVAIKLFWDKGKTGAWQLLLEATDDGKSFGGAVLGEAGHAGIRTDFMDVEFSDYKISGL